MASSCATAPDKPVSEKLDPDTATTVTVMSHPVELLSQTRGTSNDPFAYLAPFEVNRMGERDLYLWIAAPQTAEAPIDEPQVLCNGKPVTLRPLSTPSAIPDAGSAAADAASPAPTPDLSQLSLSRPPYDNPVPWNGQWYFRLAPSELQCLAESGDIALETRAGTGNTQRYVADRKNTAALGAFVRR